MMVEYLESGVTAQLTEAISIPVFFMFCVDLCRLNMARIVVWPSR